MSILQVYEEVLKSKLFLLMLDNKVLGMRTKVYDYSTDNFLYYDFPIEFVKDNSIRQFLIKNQSLFDRLELIKCESDYKTQEEINGLYEVQEFRDTNSAHQVLRPFITIYRKEVEKYGRK